MKSFYLTDTGRVREHNEDSVTILKNISGEYLCVVADGMGGHRKGEVASALTVAHLGKRFTESASIGTKIDAVNWLSDNINEINKEILNGPLVRVAQQRRGVVHRHEFKATLFHPLPMLARDLEVLADQAHRRDAAEADDQLRAQQRHLLAQIADAGVLFRLQGVTVVGRAALDDVGNIAVLFAVKVDGKQVFVQKLAAAAHKGQALLVLALARAFAHKQHLSSLGPLPEHHMGAVGAQLASAAGKALSL